MMQKRIYERVFAVARGGMHHKAFGFVDDDYVVVLKDDVEGDIFARGLGRDRWRHDIRHSRARRGRCRRSG